MKMKSKHNSLVKILTFATSLSLAVSLPLYSALANSVSPTVIKAAPGPGPRTTPGNRQAPGGSLNGSTCVQPQKKITALAPMKPVYGATLLANPTFWFHTDYTSEEIQYGEFIILTRDDEQRVYKISFALPDTPGFVSVSVPASENLGLQKGQLYHWYMNLYCVASDNADLSLDGWIERFASTQELEQQVNATTPDVWYDAINHLIEQFHASGELNQPWNELLDSVELGELVQEPFIGPVIPIDETALRQSE